MNKGLKGSIVQINELSDSLKKEMYELFITYFVVSEKVFMEDMSKKDEVLLLCDEKTGAIKGFSTIKLIHLTVEHVRIKAIFSGDTIIDTLYRSETELIKHVGRFVYERIEEEVKFYWFLITMGFRTYRFLPLFFHEYYPRYDKHTPVFEQKVMNALAVKEFGNCYNKEMGVIIPTSENYLKETYATIPSRRLANPHIEYFLKRNPGFAKGEELVCIAEISKQNFKPIFYRITK
jgi:hypothetical protein